MRKQIHLILLIVFFLNIEKPCIAQSPFKLSSPGDYITGGLLIPINLGASSLYKNKKSLTEDRVIALDINNINRFDRSATCQYSERSDKISDVLLITCLIGPTLLLLKKDIRKDAMITVVIGIETAGITAAEVQFIKGLVNRPRPFVYNPDFPMSKKLQRDATCSFISGHTAMATASCFFAAGIYEGYHPDSNKWIWFAAAVPALTTGFLRYKAGKHFFTDILTGFIAGSLNGYLITQLHKD